MRDAHNKAAIKTRIGLIVLATCLICSRALAQWTENTVVKSGSTFYVFKNGELHWIAGLKAFVPYRGKPVTPADATQIASAKKGTPETAESELLRNQATGAVYRIEGGHLRWIPNPETFKKMKLEGLEIPDVESNLLHTIPEGTPYPDLSGKCHPKGTFCGGPLGPVHSDICCSMEAARASNGGYYCK